MNGVWAEWALPDAMPTRATCEAKLAAPELLVEIIVTAAKRPPFKVAVAGGVVAITLPARSTIRRVERKRSASTASRACSSTRSARLPGSMLPIWSATPNACAGTRVRPARPSA
ncbi:hypothetical protein G6F46_014084 [Rhizopus delemar]|nr:hypothetical protein G6F46_014084 [Rhizopus delemar]